MTLRELVGVDAMAIIPDPEMPEDVMELRIGDRVVGTVVGLGPLLERAFADDEEDPDGDAGLANVEIELVDDLPEHAPDDPDAWRGPNGECPICGRVDCATGEGCSFDRGPQ